jgi:hypothetical protein
VPSSSVVYLSGLGSGVAVGVAVGVCVGVIVAVGSGVFVLTSIAIGKTNGGVGSGEHATSKIAAIRRTMNLNISCIGE